MQPTRRILILVPLVMAVALIGTVLSSYFSVHAVLATLARGQGDAMLDSIRHGRSSDPAFLEALLEEQREEGLRCIAVLGRDLDPVAVVGECLASDAEALRQAVRTSGPDEAVPAGRRVRMVRGGPSPGGKGLTGSRSAILIEFEPILTRALERGAIRSLGIGGAASLALVLVAVGLWRFSVREACLEERLERDRRLASLGEMAAVLAHEIRNPLTSMKGHAQLLAERLAPESVEREKAGRVVREAVRLEELTADLLSFIRSEQVEREAVDPVEVLRSAAGEVGPEQIDLETQEAPPSWSLDPRLIRQALGNLLRNALQASPDGARATVSVGSRGDALVYRVRDRGPGVPEGERDRIFEPFYTTRTRGTGLGLAVTRRIVELHGGTVTTANLREGGAEFQVTIPAAP